MLNIKIRLVLFLAGMVFCCFAPQKSKVIQIDISSLLNARPVTILGNGRLVSWTKGIDGGGDGDGYLTHSAAEFNGDHEVRALPDNSMFAANNRHPEIVLHYHNGDSVHNQARFLSGQGEFTIPVPKGNYSAIYLGLSSAEGTSTLQFELIYDSSKELKNYTLLDYYNNAPEGQTDLSYVATDLAKWGKNDKMTEKNHHNIHLLKLNINPGKKLTAIRLKKTKEGYLIFWSATGIRI